MEKPNETKITTEAFAQKHGVKPASVRARVYACGDWFGIRPEKLANGRLLWPAVVLTK